MSLKMYESYIFASYLPQFIAALLIIFFGTLTACFLKRFVRHGIKVKNNETLKIFLANLIFAAVLVVTIIMGLEKLGVPTTTLVTILGVGSLAIGLALKDFLSNIAAGLMIIFLRPFKIGDYVVADGNAGTIVDINLFMIQLQSPTNESIFLPNNSIIVNPITNQTFYKTRRLDIEVGIGYEADLKKAKNVIEKILAKADYAIQAEPSMIGVTNLADNSIIILIRFWVLTENYTFAKHQLLETIKQQFNENNISLPFPQLDLHIKREFGTKR